MDHETVTEEPVVEQFEYEEDLDFGEILPTMNVQPLAIPDEEKPCIVTDEALLGLYDEILVNCRTDRSRVDDLLESFLNMVLNDGDSSSSSKEAVVNLMKIKAEISDKMAKVADLETRIKLKDRDTFKPYLSAHQHNNVTIESGNNKRDLLKAIQKAKKK